MFRSRYRHPHPRGDVLIEDLRVGDLVVTADNGPQRIRWIGRSHFGARALATTPRLRPVLIRRGVLGAERDLLVSRQHGLLIGDHLVRSIHLTDRPGIRIANGRRSVTYFHLMFDAHQIIFSEHIPTESFLPGPFTFATFSEARLREFEAAFPGLIGQVRDLAAAPERRSLTARQFVHPRDAGSLSLIPRPRV